jgi:hypothetical protein
MPKLRFAQPVEQRVFIHQLLFEFGNFVGDGDLLASVSVARVALSRITTLLGRDIEKMLWYILSVLVMEG